jgi:hypothetical protein
MIAQPDWMKTTQSVLSASNIQQLGFLESCKTSIGLSYTFSGSPASAQKDLELLGPSRQTIADQRRFLTRLANAYQLDVSNALSGNYDSELDGNSPIKLRLHISRLSDEFSECMSRFGHAKIFQDVHGGLDEAYDKRRQRRHHGLDSCSLSGVSWSIAPRNRQSESPREHVSTTVKPVEEHCDYVH